MKTNGSMICRQRHINNAIRERRTPWAYPLPAAPRSHWPTLALLTPLPSLLLLPPMTSFARRVGSSWLVGWIFCLWEAKQKCGQNLIATGVSLLAALTRVSAVIVYSASPLSDCHSHLCPFLLVLFLSPPASPSLICHVERTCRQNRAHRGTAVYLNPLMGSVGS